MAASQGIEHPSGEPEREEQQDWEALGNVGLAVTDVFLILPRMIFDPPSRLRVSPEVGYERYWRPERWEAEPGSEPPAQGPLVALQVAGIQRHPPPVRRLDLG